MILIFIQILPLFLSLFIPDVLNALVLDAFGEAPSPDAIKMFETNPIFGVGIKNFRKLCSKDQYKISELSCSTHPHNTYIQLLAETGIIGFLIILLCFIYFSFVSIKYLFSKNYREDNLFDFQVCITSAIMISLWPLVPTGNFFNNWLNIIYFYPLGIYLWSNQTLKNKKNISI